MSQKQREKVKARFEQNIERLEDTEMVRALVTDSAWKMSIAKVGRNDMCPCGSRVKYKRCHGR